MNGIWKSILMAVTLTALTVVSIGVSAQEKFFTLEPIETKGIKTTDSHIAHALDYFAPGGTHVYPIAPGKVVEVVTGGVAIGTGTEHTGIDPKTNKYTGKDPNGKSILDYDPGRGMGNYVIIEHEAPDGKKFYSTYAHMESVAVAKGAEAKIDTPIGAVGDTGLYISEVSKERVPHLHVQVDNVEPMKNENTGKLFPVLPYKATDSRHGDRDTKKLTEDPKKIIEIYADKTSTYGTSRQKYNEYVKAQDKSAPPAIVTKPTAEDKTTKILKERVEILKEEIKKAQAQIQSKTEAWNRVKEDFMKIGIIIFNNIMKAKIPTGIYIPEGFLPSELQASILNTLDKDKLRGGDPHQNVTPVKDIPFTQTYIGTYEKPSSSPYNVATYTNTSPGSGTRTGVYPGSFTVNHSITATSTENNTFSSYSSGTFSASMSGTVSGLQGGKLKGTGNMNMTAGTSGGTNFNLSGPITIEPSGKLTSSTNGTFTLGGNSGTTTGTWVQTPQ